MALSNTQVGTIAKLLSINLSAICLQEDLKKMEIEDNTGYIINYGNMDNGGTHYVCIATDDKGHAFFFDSFGVIPDNDVIAFMKRGKKRWGYNNWIIQDIKSSLCGWYCLGVIKVCLSKRRGSLFDKANSFINFFKDNTLFNAPILRGFFYTWFSQIDSSVPKQLITILNSK